MSDSYAYAQAAGELRAVLARAHEMPAMQSIIQARKEVLARFTPMFSPEHISQLDQGEMRSFLLFANNKHWTGLHRQGNRITQDMDLLRSVLAVLLDEARPIDERVDQAVKSIYGMGPAIVTAILLVAYPDKYGVWNKPSEGALLQLGVWPEFERGESTGSRYAKINAILNRLAADTGVDLWTLDALLWYLVEAAPLPLPDSLAESGQGEAPRFGLERHLHEFLRDNWDQTELGRQWAIYEENGDPEAGYEYPTDVGRIDLLARARDNSGWLVVELKRDQAGDATMGQVLRYMGWVRAKLAQPGEKVQGLIIGRQADEALMYAVRAVPDVAVRVYEVSFKLREAGL